MDRAPAAGNLDDDNQSKRLRFGVLAALCALSLAVALLELGAPAPVRALLFVPFLAASFGLYQGLHRT